MKKTQRALSVILCFLVAVTTLTVPFHARAITLSDLMHSDVSGWVDSGNTTNTWNNIDNSSTNYTVNKPQNYYTTVTNTTVDKSGNVTNYYRGGDTTNTKIIDSYNKTFNTIYNTTNNSTTNKYSANVKLNDFLNQYTTNHVTTNNTYSADFKSWYYDNQTHNYNYSQNNLYYNQDNSQYYISIDNSKDEYYLVDVKYSPTFVTVNYTYNTTNINNEKVGDVTNIYYYELKDGRNSSTLSASEIAGMDTDYDAANDELVTDDPNTLSLQHFDGNYTDSSSFNRTFYSQNRSSTYADSGTFGKAVSLPSGSAAGVTIPNLSTYSNLTFDFRVYCPDFANLGVYFGGTNLFREVPSYRYWTGTAVYTDDGKTFEVSAPYGTYELSGPYYTSSQINYPGAVSSATTIVSGMSAPASYSSSGYKQRSYSPKKYGWFSESGSPTLYDSDRKLGWRCVQWKQPSSPSSDQWGHSFVYYNRADLEYRWTPTKSVVADFSYDSYKNQWVSMRITLSGGKIYYFVNGDLVGAGSFTKPTADKFYIKSSGTLYLDELRVTTGTLSSNSVYEPSSAPYDTNKVLALPDSLTANTIYVQHSTKVTNLRIGGVRPSNPAPGFLYIPLYDDRTASQPQLYDGNNWIDVTAMVYNGKTTVNVLGYKFSPVGDAPDVDMDAKPERPVKPGEDVDPGTCAHDWKETGRTAATCSVPGFIEYTCSKCKTTKKETLSKLAHTWEIKQTVQTTYDDKGNITVQGFVLYRCSVCGEEYKDVHGSGPPGTSSGDSDEDEGFLSWLLRKAGELLGAVGDGIIGLLKAALGKILDGLIDLVNMAFEKLTQLVDLFGSFGDALGVLWTWLPEEIMLVLVAGVTVFVFVALLKLFMK